MDSYALSLGKILANLHALEFALRAFLHEAEGTPASTDYQSLRVGDQVPEDAFTNYDTLGQLVEKFNARIKATAPELYLDSAVVDLRDALAHGRVSASVASGPWRLLKFGRATSGQVEVTHAVEMSPEWLSGQVGNVWTQCQNVVVAARRLGLTSFEHTNILGQTS